MGIPSIDSTTIQDQLNASMPWIGMYIAAASAICSLAMAADAFNGFRGKKFWFPCKYFSLNATSLTLLAVSMKLPLDLTTRLSARSDWLANLSSLIFMSTAMGNFAPSIGSMEDKEILTNVTALAILVITIIANVWIQLIELRSILPLEGLLSETLFACIFMLLLLLNIVSSAITAPITKKILQTKYQEIHKIIMNGENQQMNVRERFRDDKRRDALKKHLVMAETSSPQFVMARSVICAASSVISLIAAFTLAVAYIRQKILANKLKRYLGTTSPYDSPYEWSTSWILVIQTIGVAVGTISPILRCFSVVGFKWSQIRSFEKEFKIEGYWIQRLVDWREFSTSSEIRHHTCRKYLHSAKRLVSSFCIGAQKLVILFNKLVVFISALLMSPFLYFFTCIKKLKLVHLPGISSSEMDLSHYVLLVEGEAKLPKKTLDNISHQADTLLRASKKQQPKNLIKLLEKSRNLSGVREFDSNRVPTLHSQEPPNCWSLPIVTLASVATALANIPHNEAKQFMSRVSEGLSLAKLTDDTLDCNGELANIRNAAAVSWIGVAYYRRWQEIDFHQLSGKNSKEILQELSDKAERIIMEFKREYLKDILMENPLNWPPKIIAANSMYRISRTILLVCEGNDSLTDEGLFELLNVMVADILVACLYNLPRVMSTKCHHVAIAEREKSVQEAFVLLGKTEQVLGFLQKFEWPCVDPDRAAYIEEWRAALEPESKTLGEIERCGEHVAVTVQM